MSRPVVVLDQSQTKVPKPDMDRAVGAAFRLTMSPHEWTWTNDETVAMARFVLWAHQKLDAINQITTDGLVHQKDVPSDGR